MKAATISLRPRVFNDRPPQLLLCIDERLGFCRRHDLHLSAMKRRQFIAELAGAAAWPVLGRAQQPALPVIGYLSAGSESQSQTAAFREGVGELDYFPAQN